MAEMLRGSTCVFQLRVHGEITVDEDFRADLAAHGGLISFSDSDDHIVATIEIPHDQVDAFGGVYLLGMLPLSPARFSEAGEWTGTAAGFDFRHAWYTTASAFQGSNFTLTQQFVSALRLALPWIAEEKLAFPVLVETLAELNPATKWGNSLAIVTLNSDQLSDLLRANKEVWSATLRERSHRVLSIARRGRRLPKYEGSLLVSSLGNLDKYAWAPDLDPSSLAMVPTPLSNQSANLVLWARSGMQCLAICANKSHPLMADWRVVVSAWKEIVK